MKQLSCILLIDDDDATNFINERIIAKWGGAEHIQICDGGDLALNFLASPDDDGEYPQPELIFLDINMPGMDGWEFLDHYRRLPLAQQGKTVVAMLTTSANPDDEAKANQLGLVNTFRRKPLTVAMLEELRSEFFQT